MIGVLLVLKPVQGAVSLTVVLTAFFIAEGVFQTAVAFASRHVMAGTWGWMLMSGLADLVLAAIIIAGWPGTAIWALGLLVGINLLTSGCAVVVAALAGGRWRGRRGGVGAALKPAISTSGGCHPHRRARYRLRQAAAQLRHGASRHGARTVVATTASSPPR